MRRCVLAFDARSGLLRAAWTLMVVTQRPLGGDRVRVLTVVEAARGPFRRVALPRGDRPPALLSRRSLR